MTFDQPQLALLLSRRAVLIESRSALPDAPQVPPPTPEQEERDRRGVPGDAGAR
ncbi:hypothetical protein [Cellulomonas hominis]|uniref:hypothetical protein n=1 Tax=Cellulomonas hominis TaxID=156981 RepID=UPI001B92E8BD|nr:hypothetical protein [Cellulomonas hominis]VTR76138.1 hypothetical protein CHMI_00894 [Cellulomonas hominis]